MVDGDKSLCLDCLGVFVLRLQVAKPPPRDVAVVGVFEILEQLESIFPHLIAFVIATVVGCIGVATFKPRGDGPPFVGVCPVVVIMHVFWCCAGHPI